MKKIGSDACTLHASHSRTIVQTFLCLASGWGALGSVPAIAKDNEDVRYPSLWNATRDPSVDGVPPLRFGMSTALTGSAAGLGTSVLNGVSAAFAEANRAGGVQGRPLELIVLDDGYEPSRTAPNTRQLIKDHDVLAIVGNVGTPTAVTAMPLAIRNETVLFGAVTGAAVLRKPVPNRYVINYRASYAEETAAMVDALINSGVQPEKIAFFTQNDSFGDDGYFGGLAAIKQHQNLAPSSIAHGRYTRNTLNVEAALADLLLHEPLPEAVILVGTSDPCAKLIKLAKENGFQPKFLCISFVDSDALRQALGEDADGIVVTQVVPHAGSDVPRALAFRAAIAALNAECNTDAVPTFGSFEGYIVGSIVCDALQNIEGEITRERLVDSLEQLGDFDIGLGIRLSLSASDHQASDTVWPTRLTTHSAIPMAWEEL